MIIRKKNTSEKKDRNWFNFAMGLKLHVFSDYLSLKFDFQLEPLTFAPTIFARMAELAEKSLKMFLALSEQKDNALSHYASTYGHNIKKLREQAEMFSESFSEQDIVDFSLVFDDKRGALFQHLRYGSQMTIDGYSTNLGTLMPIVEKIFFYSCLELPKEWKKMVNFNSRLFHLLTNGRFDQSRNPKILLEAVRINNPFISDYESYCQQMIDEQEELRKKFEQKKDNKN